MPRTEVLTTLRIRLLDLHVRIAEPNDDNLASRILDVHRTLLPLTRSVERLVQRDLLALVLCHIRTGIGVNPAIP